MKEQADKAGEGLANAYAAKRTEIMLEPSGRFMWGQAYREAFLAGRASLLTELERLQGGWDFCTDLLNAECKTSRALESQLSAAQEALLAVIAATDTESYLNDRLADALDVARKLVST